MQAFVERVGAKSWQIALILMLLALPATFGPHAYTVIHIALLGAVVLFLWGAFRLMGRVPTHPGLHDKTRLAFAVLGSIALLGPVARIPWFLYTGWHRIETDSAIPAWAGPLSWWSAVAILIGALMLGLWIGWSVLVQSSGRPSRVSTLSVGVLAFGLWIPALCFVMVQRDRTAEDLLMILPAGIVIAGLGLLGLLASLVHAPPEPGTATRQDSP